MKKILIFLCLLLIGTSVYVIAAPQPFEITFDSDVVVFKGVPINTDVNLIGNEAPVKTNVRVKVEISGPATPTLLATDSEGVEHDIAKLGYWGPEQGFAVGGTFKNTTPVKATFPETGLYEITLSLIDVTDTTVITSNKTNIYVYTDQAEYDKIQAEQNQANNISNNIANNMINNTNNTNNTLTQMPQTGASTSQFLIYGVLLALIIGIGYKLVKKSNIH